MSISNDTLSPVGILAAGGAMPFAVADILRAKNREVVIFGLEGICDPAAMTRYRHHWVAVAQIGRLFRLLESENVRDLLMVGAMFRPAIRDMRLDWTAIKLIPQYMTALRGGDDHLLVKIGRMFEDRGFRWLGLCDVAPEILMPKGLLTRAAPDADALADIALGETVLRALSPFDVGQAVAVIDRHVVGIEGLEGTDALLARLTQLRSDGRLRTKPGRGVLVKAPKAGQDLRFDLPTVGPQTINGTVAAKLAGIAVAAGSAVAVEPDTMIREADRSGVFLFGISP